MNTVDLKTLSAASPSALFESLESVVQEPIDAAITIIYTEGAEVTGVETHQLPISWVDLVEDIPFNALQHSAQGFVIIVWGERAGEDLPNIFGQVRDSRNLKRLVLKYYPEWRYGFHAFRAWFISYGLLESGASDVQMARLVVHAKTSMTKDIYGRQLDEGALRVTESVDNALQN